MGLSAGCSIENTCAKGTIRNMATSRLACSPAYGGSANPTSYWPGCSCSVNLSASTRVMTARSSTFKLFRLRSEEHTSELQSQSNLVCRLLLEKKKNKQRKMTTLQSRATGTESRTSATRRL